MVNALGSIVVMELLLKYTIVVSKVIGILLAGSSVSKFSLKSSSTMFVDPIDVSV